MVRQVADNPIAGGKAFLAIAVVTGGLLWHLLACTESPMAFSPEGDKLAFVTMEPYGQDDILAAGTCAYRLMVLTDSKRVRILEETTDHMLTAPAYSPDGKHLCYLRVPLLSDEKRAGLQAYIEETKKEPDRSSEFQWAKPPSIEETVETEDLTLPPIEASFELFKNLDNELFAPATLVVRSLDTSAVVSETTIEIPIGEDPGHDLLMIYVLARPQYSPDGRWIYVCAGNVVFAANPSENKVHVLAFPARTIALSPDGTTVAVLHDSTLAFLQKDGSRAVYLRVEKGKTSLGGLTWLDGNTAAIVTSSGEENQIVLQRVRSDGTPAGEKALPLPKPAKGEDTASIAWTVSSDGRHMVVVQGEDTFFMKTDGTVLNRWEGGEKEVLAQPTFTPDSKRVAFKHMTKRDNSNPRVDSIVFFTPQGKEMDRAAIPKIDPATTMPASKAKEDQR